MAAVFVVAPFFTSEQMCVAQTVSRSHSSPLRLEGSVGTHRSAARTTALQCRFPPGRSCCVWSVSAALSLHKRKKKKEYFYSVYCCGHHIRPSRMSPQIVDKEVRYKNLVQDNNQFIKKLIVIKSGIKVVQRLYGSRV